MAMDFLNEENKNNLIIRDLQKLGKVLYHENDSFKLALKRQLREKAAGRPQTDFKKLFSLKWVWVTAPAALLLFVMLAEAAEYAGLEIKPYHYLKTTTLPAVSKQVKRVATTVAKKVEKIAVRPAEKKIINEKVKTPSSTTPSNLLIAFEPLTNQEKLQFIQEINNKLAKEPASAGLQPTYSGQQPADFQPQKPQKLAYDTGAYYQTKKEELKPAPKQIIKDNIINQEDITTPAADSASSSAEPQTAIQHAKDILNNPKQLSEKTSAENITSQKPLPEEIKPNLDSQKKEEPNYKLPVQSQPKDEPEKDISIAKVQPTPSITTVKESDALSKVESEIDNKPNLVCQNKTEIILRTKNIQEATEKINSILHGLDINIIERKFGDTENNLTLIASLEQYAKLIQAIKNASLEIEEKVIVKKDDCKEILSIMYLRKKPSLLKKLFTPSPDKPLK